MFVCLNQLRAYVRRYITTGTHPEERGRGERILQNGGREQGLEKERLQTRNPVGRRTGSTESRRRRLLPQLSSCHDNLCSGCPHLSRQDNDTTGWEGVWGVVRTDRHKSGSKALEGAGKGS